MSSHHGSLIPPAETILVENAGDGPHNSHLRVIGGMLGVMAFCGNLGPKAMRERLKCVELMGSGDLHSASLLQIQAVYK